MSPRRTGETNMTATIITLPGFGRFAITIDDDYNATARALSAKAFAAVAGVPSATKEAEAMRRRQEDLCRLADVGNRHLEILPA
jgi:hypothetical protein